MATILRFRPMGVIFTFAFLLLASCGEQGEIAPVFDLSLEGLPQIRVQSYPSDTTYDCGYFLLTAQDLKAKPEGRTPYFNSCVQIIEKDHPWPPLWFANMPPDPPELDRRVIDVKKMPNGNIAFYFNDPQNTITSLVINRSNLPDDIIFSGHVSLDENFNVVDILSVRYVDEHDYMVYPDGKRLYSRYDERQQDLSRIKVEERQLTDNERLRGDHIQLMDKNQKIIFNWKEFDHLEFEDAYYKKYFYIMARNPNFIDMPRINSVRLDPYDGNLLLSYRRADMCTKVNIETGEIMWRLGGKKSDFVLDDADLFYLQHDFYRITEGPYAGKFSLMNNGNRDFPFAQGFIFDINETEKTAKVVKRYRPKKAVTSVGQGNFQQLPDGCSVINYGGLKDYDEPEQLNFSYIDPSGNKIADFFAPRPANMYKVTCEQLPKLQRPQIYSQRLSADSIRLTASGNFRRFKWSTGREGQSIVIKEPGNYYVIGQKGIGGSGSLILKVADIRRHACTGLPQEGIITYQKPTEAASCEPTPESVLVKLPFNSERDTAVLNLNAEHWFYFIDACK